MTENLLKRQEFHGDSDKECKEYYIKSEDVREVYRVKDGKAELLDASTLSVSEENEVYMELSSFEEGYNRLEEIDGQLYEVMGDKHNRWITRRKAYLK